MRTTTQTRAWERVKSSLDRAKAMHWDGCHKIYLSMDDERVRLSESYGYESHAPDFDKLKGWFEESCPLRMVDAVYTVEGDPNKGYDSLIYQFEFDGRTGFLLDVTSREQTPERYAEQLAEWAHNRRTAQPPEQEPS